MGNALPLFLKCEILGDREGLQGRSTLSDNVEVDIERVLAKFKTVTR